MSGTTTTETLFVNRSATIGLNDPTLDAINAGATKVGAPATSRVSIGTGVHQVNSDEEEGNYFSYSVSFAWSEEV